MDTINSQIASGEVVNADAAGELRVVGWTATRDKRDPGAISVLLVDEESGTAYAAESATDKARPDVA